MNEAAYEAAAKVLFEMCDVQPLESWPVNAEFTRPIVDAFLAEWEPDYEAAIKHFSEMMDHPDADWNAEEYVHHIVDAALKEDT